MGRRNDIVGANIALAMRIQRLDKSKVARALDCSHTSISMKLSGARPIKIDEIERFAALLGVPSRVLAAGQRSDVLRYFADHPDVLQWDVGSSTP